MSDESTDKTENAADDKEESKGKSTSRRKSAGDPVFTSEEGVAVEIVGVGLIDGGERGKIAVPVAEAAEVLHELQDAEQKPLKGKALEEAAQAFADARGLAVEDMEPDEYEVKSSLPSVPEAAQIEAERLHSQTPKEDE